jgi:glycosyltransferase involved in cell wall biosynthesis
MLKEPLITIAFPYYGNPENLTIQLENILAFPMSLRRNFTFLVIDDGSPKPLQLPENINANISIYRINEDIPFNYPGAKNLALHCASTDWILQTDIDHVINAHAALSILHLDLTAHTRIYLFRRNFSEGSMSDPRPELRNKKFIPSTLLYNRNAIIAAGGYDEDFSGHYGHDDSILKWHLSSNHGFSLYDSEIALTCHRCAYLEPQPERNSYRNSSLYHAKRLMRQSYQPIHPLRFSWQKAASFNMA